MQPIVLELPLPPKALHPNSRPHWAAKMRATKKARGEAALVARQQKPDQPFGQATLHATFYTLRRMDDDGLTAWLKAYRDGLQDAGLVVNDAELRMLPVEQVNKCKVPERRVVLTITPVGSRPSGDSLAGFECFGK